MSFAIIIVRPDDPAMVFRGAQPGDAQQSLRGWLYAHGPTSKGRPNRIDMIGFDYTAADDGLGYLASFGLGLDGIWSLGDAPEGFEVWTSNFDRAVEGFVQAAGRFALYELKEVTPA